MSRSQPPSRSQPWRQPRRLSVDQTAGLHLKVSAILQAPKTLLAQVLHPALQATEPLGDALLPGLDTLVLGDHVHRPRLRPVGLGSLGAAVSPGLDQLGHSGLGHGIRVQTVHDEQAQYVPTRLLS